MKKYIILALLVAAAPLAANAQVNNNVGSCGWGSKLFDGQRGIAPQVLAVTTNGTSGNQTFAITSGTSGCTQDGLVKSSWKTAAYLDQNMNKVARDASRGQGESLTSLADLIGVRAEHKGLFAQVMKDNFNVIFSSTDVNSESVAAKIKEVLAANDRLAIYSANM